MSSEESPGHSLQMDCERCGIKNMGPFESLKHEIKHHTPVYSPLYFWLKRRLS